MLEEKGTENPVKAQINRKKQEDEDETVLKQGHKYEEQGTEAESGETVTVLNATNEAITDEKSGKNKLPIIIAAVAGVILVTVAGLVTYNYQEQKRIAEEQARAEALLAEEQKFEYSLEEIEELRLNGYTGDEIEDFENLEIPAADKIAEAEQARKEKYDAEIKPYLDGASEQYKQLEAMTWVGQSELMYDTNAEGFTYYNKTLNLDYDKLPPRGHQLMLQVYLLNGDALYMTVTPERYAELLDSGNIVVNLSYTKTADGKTIVTDLKEIIN